MAEKGALIVRAFVSRAQLPVRDATVIVSAPGPEGKQQLLSILQTNESGLAGPIQLDAPAPGASTQPNSGAAPSTDYTLVVEHPDYQLAVFEHLQIFPGVTTTQDVALIPISWASEEQPDISVITPQPL